MSPELHIYFGILAFVFGAVVGSFLNVCVHRMPREESIVNPPSHCPSCNQRIFWYDNVPLVSYAVLQGRCRHCRARISPRYVLVELLTAVLFLIVWGKFTGWLIPLYWIVVAGLLVATFIDLEHYIIPNEITYGGIVLGLALSPINPVLRAEHSVFGAMLQSVFGMVIGGGLLLGIAWIGGKVFKKEAMGMGDVKLLAAIGAFMGWQATLFTLFISSVVGAVVGLTLVLAQRKGWQSRLPYGPYIALGALIWMLCGTALVDWYLAFLKGTPSL